MLTPRGLLNLCSFVLLTVVFSVGACQHPMPNPGQVLVTCGMQIAQDPAVQKEILDAFIQPDWNARIAALLVQVPGLTSEAIACILKQYLAQPQAGPGAETIRAHAHQFLQAHGYEVP